MNTPFSFGRIRPHSYNYAFLESVYAFIWIENLFLMDSKRNWKKTFQVENSDFGDNLISSAQSPKIQPLASYTSLVLKIEPIKQLIQVELSGSPNQLALFHWRLEN